VERIGRLQTRGQVHILEAADADGRSLGATEDDVAAGSQHLDDDDFLISQALLLGAKESELLGGHYEVG